VPVLADFLLESLETDMVRFTEYTPVFNSGFVTNLRAKQAAWYAHSKSKEVLKLQKAVSTKILGNTDKFRLSLNQLEGYLKLTSKDLDIPVTDFEISGIRLAINYGDLEGLIDKSRILITTVKRNETALEANGMKPEFVDELAAEVTEIATLNTNHNVKKNEHSRVADENMKVTNLLWDDLEIILNAGRAIFKGVDEVKLREYTLTHLLKRVHNKGLVSDKNSDTAKTNTTPKEDIQSA
jgi:hypothetical protein